MAWPPARPANPPTQWPTTLRNQPSPPPPRPHEHARSVTLIYARSRNPQRTPFGPPRRAKAYAGPWRQTSPATLPLRATRIRPLESSAHDCRRGEPARRADDPVGTLEASVGPAPDERFRTPAIIHPLDPLSCSDAALRMAGPRSPFARPARRVTPPALTRPGDPQVDGCASPPPCGRLPPRPREAGTGAGIAESTAVRAKEV
jgi:hypothetical protein